MYTIAAHNSLVSDVKFYRSPASGAAGAERGWDVNGLFLVSGSFDSTVKLWSADDWKLKCELTGHDGKVMSVDVTNGNLRTVKLIYYGRRQIVGLCRI